MALPRSLRLALVALCAAGMLTIIGSAQSAQAATIQMQPLGKSVGVVVANRPRSRTVIVAVGGKMRAIHGLRRYTRGTRVRIRGIKWGRVVRGIKWGARRRGVKWGIKWARNRTYEAPLDRIGRVRSTVRLSGVIIARTRTSVTLATPGGAVTVRLANALPAVTGSLSTHARSRGIGSVGTVAVGFGTGRPVGQPGSLRIVRRASKVPVSGRVAAVNAHRRTTTINATDDPDAPVRITMAVPPAMDITKVTVGSEVATLAQFSDAGALVAREVARNESFAAANDPSLIVTAPPLLPSAVLADIAGFVKQVDIAVTTGQFSDAAIAAAAHGHAVTAQSRAAVSDVRGALTALDQFIVTIADARASAVVSNGQGTALINRADQTRHLLQGLIS